MKPAALLALTFLAAFATTAQAQDCAQNCTSNGFCVDGICHCNAGWVRADCSGELQGSGLTVYKVTAAVRSTGLCSVARCQALRVIILFAASVIAVVAVWRIAVVLSLKARTQRRFNCLWCDPQIQVRATAVDFRSSAHSAQILALIVVCNIFVVLAWIDIYLVEGIWPTHDANLGSSLVACCFHDGAGRDFELLRAVVSGAVL